VGYDSITPKAPLVPAVVPPGNPLRRFQHEVRTLFIDNGYTEVYNYSFLSEESVRAFGFDPAAHIHVLNPIASNQELMRASLLPGIWRNVIENAKHHESFRIYEIGLEIHRRPEGLPDEIPHLVATLFDRQDGGIFELKRVAECLMPGAKTLPTEARAYEHPARAAEVEWDGTVVGRLFELHPNLVDVGRASVLDRDLRLVESLSDRKIKYTPIRRYPSSAFDLSVIAPLRELAGKLEAAIASFAGPLLEDIQFVRQYAGAPLAEGTKSVSFRLTVGSAERTLSSDEIAGVRNAIIEGMRASGYELRV
jgi:phenylalanyl-tRNA synthetase beta chain